ncbi:MAG: hypothetical protein EP344_19065 [Bacteroidetes bacterium]|nr:MAG: hypothetical protein EP344_19065 [Bacteroidota bacterium]
MNKTKYSIGLVLMFLLLFALVACERANDKNPDLIGDWQGREWLIFNKPSGLDASKVTFSFTADGAYAAAFGDQQEQGVWRTDKDKLYTTAEGKKEIMVKILQLDSALLKFEMNRGGQQETIELGRKQ